MHACMHTYTHTTTTTTTWGTCVCQICASALKWLADISAGCLHVSFDSCSTDHGQSSTVSWGWLIRQVGMSMMFGAMLFADAGFCRCRHQPNFPAALPRPKHINKTENLRALVCCRLPHENSRGASLHDFLDVFRRANHKRILLEGPLYGSR